MSNDKTLQVGFIGLGIMGRSMAGQIQRAGHALHVATMLGVCDGLAYAQHAWPPRSA